MRDMGMEIDGIPVTPSRIAHNDLKLYIPPRINKRKKNWMAWHQHHPPAWVTIIAAGNGGPLGRQQGLLSTLQMSLWELITLR